MHWTVKILAALLLVLIVGGYDVRRPTTIPCEVLGRTSDWHVVEPCIAGHDGTCEGVPVPTWYGRLCTGEQDLLVSPDDDVDE